MLIGFIGSYAAVRTLAEAKHFGAFAVLFPIGLDAGILVLLALDLLLTWLRMPLPLLRHIAWLLTAATIAFNGAAAWGDPVGVGMHAVIPILFVAVVEAARHAIGTAADISAARHMESVRLSRWLLAPVRTFLLWRRMKLWELRSYDDVIRLEQARLVERLRLRAEYGRMWRQHAPVEVLIAYRMTRYGRPLAPAEGAVAAPAPAAPIEQPALDAPAPQGAPALPAPPPAAPESSAPARPAPKTEGAPTALTPTDQGAPAQPALDEQPTAPTTEDTPAAAEGDTPRGDRPPTRTEVKNKIRALYDTLDARPGEGVIVKLLEDEAKRGYPYTSRRHAQALRKEIETAEPKLLERGTDNVTALTGS
ncbi:DUF2637 domain-containing protein [Streptomyces sp. NPDC085944]|uniref:DUF2637 domain-containing protein n=1 Tax=Streptomyces sp. NPDC085944 TaxID=3154962 RepID=UPI00341A4FC1